MKLIRLYFILLSLVILGNIGFTSCGKDKADEPEVTEKDHNKGEQIPFDNIPPFSQQFLSEENVNPARQECLFIWNDVDPYTLTKEEFKAECKERNIPDMGPQAFTPYHVSIGDINIFGAYDWVKHLFVSAHGGKITFRSMFPMVGGDLKYDVKTLRWYTETPTRGEDQFKFESDPDNATIYLTLSENKSGDFRVMQLNLYNSATESIIPDSDETYHIGTEWVIIQFPWSDDIRLLDDPILTAWPDYTDSNDLSDN